MKIGFAGLRLLLAAALLSFASGASADQTKQHIRPIYNLGPYKSHLPPCGLLVTQLPHWNGNFTDLNGKTACYTMVGTDPAKGSSTTTIPVYIIPIKMKFGKQNGDMTFDPEKHTVSNGLTVIQNVAASPIFDGSTDYTQGGTDLGKTQYVDAFQRGNFWSSVKKNSGYHVLLGDPQTLAEQEIDVSSKDGTVQTINGITFGEMDHAAFAKKLVYFLQKFSQINSGVLPIFVTYNIYLTDKDQCCVGGYHNVLPYCLILCPTYVYTTYIDTNGLNKIFAQDVSALSHEIGEWMDDPFANNIVSCADPSINHHLEVGDPLEGKDRGKDGWGDYPYSLNGFKYNLQSLAFLGYFGAPPDTSVNSWTSFQGPKDNLGVCSGFTTFDPSGSTGTYPYSINSAGAITGSYYDKNGVGHGFVRAADGTITEFDVGSADSGGTSINDAGSIAGYYYDSNGLYHGFVRAADGTITEFDPSGSTQTGATSINDGGSIAGYYYDNNNVPHGFVRAADGTISVFDPSGSIATFAAGINDAGLIAGTYYDNKTAHGYVRAADGTITVFDAPKSIDTGAASINDNGVIAGLYYESSDLARGYVRAADGTITAFVAGDQTYPESINGDGSIVGYSYDEGQFKNHGFVRAADGTITVIDPPKSNGTEPYSVNDNGVIAGYYTDGKSVVHGFVGSP